jgi:cellulose synthase operon protein C
MRKPFRKSLLSLAIAHALGSGIGWPATALATDTQQPSAAAAFAQNRDIMRELIELKSAVVDSPDDAGLRFRLGQLYLRMGDAAGAEKELMRARDLGLQDYELSLALGEAWIVQGQFRRVFTDDALLAAQGPEQLAALKTLQGTSLMVEGRLDEAREHFTEALLQVQGYGPALLGIAEAELEAGEVVAAQQAMGRARIATGLEPAELLRVEGNLAFKLGRFEEAEKLYQQAVERRRGDPILLRSLAVTQLQHGDPETAIKTLDELLALVPSSADSIALKAQAALRAQDYRLARELAESVMGTTEQRPELLFVAGTAAYYLGEPRQAREYLERYVAAHPNVAAGRRVLGTVLLSVGDGPGAHAALQPLAAEAGNDASLHALIAQAALASGHGQEAIDRFARAVELAPESDMLRANLATARLMFGDRRLGIDELATAAQAGSAVGAQSALTLARYRLAEDDLDGALAAALAYRQARPESAASWLIEGLALLRRGDLDDARVAFEHAVELEPEQSDAYTGLSEILLREGKSDATLRMREQEFGNQADNVAVQLTLATLEAANGRARESQQRLEALVQRAPDNTRARITLADQHLRTGEYEGAEALIEEAPDPDSLAMRVFAARLALARARPNAALKLLDPLEGGDTHTRVAGLLVLARAQLDLGDMPSATATFEQAAAAASDPTRTSAENARATLLDPTASAASLRQAINDVGALMNTYGADSPAMLELRGLAGLRMDGMAEQGLALLRRARQAERSGEITIVLANALASRGETAEGVKILDAWTDLRPQDTRAYLARARLLMQQGLYARAATDLRTALEQGADLSELPLLLAWNQAVAGDAAGSRATLKTAGITLASRTDAVALHTQALLALDTGDRLQALELLRRAVQQGTSIPARLRLDLAQLLVDSGQKDDARRELKALVENGPAGADRDAARAMLARLKNSAR